MPRPKKEKPNRKDNLYEVKITVGKKLDGSLIRKSFYSPISKADARKRAKEWEIQRELSEITGNLFTDSNITFERWALQWLETYKKGKVKEHTYHFTYRINVEKYMIPYFGKTRIRDISQGMIQQYFNEHDFLAENNLKRHHMILKNIFDKAIYNDICAKNPVTGIEYKSKKPAVQKRTYTQEEVNRIIEYCKKDEKAAMIVIMLETGVRRSELLGLKWSDINWEQQIISVRRAVTPDTIIPKDGGTKSKNSMRDIPVSQDFLLYLSGLPKQSEYILSGKTEYGYLSIDGFEKRYKTVMRRVSGDLNLPALTPHELRHTYGTILRERDVDIYTISKVMGHSDISITAKVYVHNDLDVLRSKMKFSN